MTLKNQIAVIPNAAFMAPFASSLAVVSLAHTEAIKHFAGTETLLKAGRHWHLEVQWCVRIDRRSYKKFSAQFLEKI